MEQQSYYRMMDSSNDNLADHSVPLLINCVGYTHLSKPFRSESVRNDYYLQIMDKGLLRMKLGGVWTDFRPGQFMIHTPELPYAYELTPGSGDMCYYWVHFTGSHAAALLRNAGLSTDTLYTLRSPDSGIRRVFTELFREFMIRDRGFDDACASLLSGAVIELGRGVGSDEADSMAKSRLARSLTYIHSHYTAGIRVEELASMEHLSVSRYRSVFRMITGTSPTEYIISLRLRHAKDLLVSTDYTVTQIAAICGYPDVLYFIRLFRKKTGVTPGEYR